MRKANIITREIMFVSKKDGQIKVVTNDDELEFAHKLENDETVVRYRTSVPLENFAKIIYLTNIRKAYREADWLTSFVVEYADGTNVAYEIIRLYHLEKRAEVEKLEISRRYWTAVGVDKWQMIIMGGAGHGK